MTNPTHSIRAAHRILITTIIDSAQGLEDWYLEALDSSTTTDDLGKTLVAIKNAAIEINTDLGQVYALYADGYELDVQAWCTAKSITTGILTDLISRMDPTR
jgi:hypothetical protein